MKTSYNVFVGDFGRTEITDKCMEAYGITKLVPKPRKKKEKDALARLNRNIAAMQEHEWIMGGVLKKV